MEILKIAVICVICAVLSCVIKPLHAESSLLLSLGAVVICSFFIIDAISDVKTKLGLLFDMTDISSTYIQAAFKALGICYVCELSSSSCRDSGESALASVIDICGRVSIVIVCIPLLDKLMDVIKSFLEM